MGWKWSVIGEIWCRPTRGGALQSELGDLGEQREGLVGVVKHVDV